jgi:hypothetical protein
MKTLLAALLVLPLLAPVAASAAEPKGLFDEKSPLQTRRQGINPKDPFWIQRLRQHEARKAEDRDLREDQEFLEQRILDRHLDHPEIVEEDEDIERELLREDAEVK